MNKGSLILINTAKELLKEEGSGVLGRFFIALISQATQERSSIAESERMPTFVYIDEAQDYFDHSIETLLTQARKYSVGVVLAHQFLDQFEPRLRQAVMTNTAIKMVGGLSAADASAFDAEMQCSVEFLQRMKKQQAHTEFALFVKNTTSRPVKTSIAFGQLEREPRMSGEERNALLAYNRARFSQDPPPPGNNGNGHARGLAASEDLAVL
jgi:hypothetical protein